MHDTNTRRRLLLAGGAGLFGLNALRAAGAQPAGTRRIVVGFPAGGTADALARALANLLSEDGGHTIVENRPGATGQIAADNVRIAGADGTSLLLTPSSVLTLAPQLYRKPLYDGVEDFAPVGCVCDHAFGLAVPGNSPHASVADYAAWARSQPREATYATPGAGSAPHFIGALFAREIDVPLVHVPYRGVVPGLQDLIGGQVSATVNPLPTMLEYHKAGRIRVLAVTNPSRVAALPDVPTFSEIGLPALELVEWYGVFAAKRTPPARLAEAEGALARALARPAMSRIARQLEVQPRPLDAAGLRQLLQADHQHWRDIVRTTGIQLES